MFIVTSLCTNDYVIINNENFFIKNVARIIQKLKPRHTLSAKVELSLFSFTYYISFLSLSFSLFLSLSLSLTLSPSFSPCIHMGMGVVHEVNFDQLWVLEPSSHN